MPSRGALGAPCGIVAALALLSLLLGGPAAATEEAWQALRRGGAIALIRHARAPGTGDPAGFRLGDCATQRNLSPDGRDQAARLGVRFAEERVHVARVLSSRWCRALETARLAFGDRVEPEPALDSSFQNEGARVSQTDALRSFVARWRGRDGVLALVTHQVNVTALTGTFLGEGEVVVVVPNETGFEIVGQITR